VAFITLFHLDARLKKNYSYIFTVFVDLHGIFWDDIWLIKNDHDFVLRNYLQVSLDFINDLVIRIFILIVVSLFTA